MWTIWAEYDGFDLCFDKEKGLRSYTSKPTHFYEFKSLRRIRIKWFLCYSRKLTKISELNARKASLSHAKNH